MNVVTLRVHVLLRGSGLEHVGEWRPSQATADATHVQLQQMLDAVMVAGSGWLALLTAGGNGIRVRISEVASYIVERNR